FPENRMQDVSRKIEGERSLQCGQTRKILLLPRFIQLIQNSVRILHIAGMMLTVVQFHDLAGDMRFQRAEVIRQIGQHITVHESSYQAKSAKWKATAPGREGGIKDEKTPRLS